MSTSELRPSRLGTKEHWDNVYEEELANFQEIGEEGEIWFGIESVEKMVDWAAEYVPPSTNPSILEVGSGNGTLLFALAESDYPSDRLSGIDYSPDAIKLARSIAASRGMDRITFGLCDFLKEDPRNLPDLQQAGQREAWDLVMDKGTYDAIALGEKDESGRSPADRYPARIVNLLKPGGYFLITSCNFTEDELKTNLATTETGLVYHSRIQHATFTFGGKSGSICSSVAFQKSSA